MGSPDLKSNPGDKKSNERDGTSTKERIPAPNSSSALDDALASTTEYRTHGSSFGNKLLISLPILNITISLVFIVSSYFYAYNRKGNAFLEKDHNVAFISELGDKRPESSLFTFGLILASVFTFGTVIVRYLHVKHFYVKLDGIFNNFCLAVGLLFILGKIMVCSFQISSHKNAHFVGAGIYVIFASLYGVMQTIITLQNKSLYGKLEQFVCVSRALLALGMVVGSLLTMIFLHPDLLKYNKKGYSVGQSTEWFFACCKMLFMLIFVADFWHLHPRLLLIKPNKQMLNDLVLSNIGEENGDITSFAVKKDGGTKENGAASFTGPQDELMIENLNATSKRPEGYSSSRHHVIHLTIKEE